MLEASLHEPYPTSAITVQKNQEEDPVPSIKKWTNDDIPMEKFQTDGVSQLSESELLAIIIGNGPKEFPTVDLMNQMLDDCGNDNCSKTHSGCRICTDDLARPYHPRE